MRSIILAVLLITSCANVGDGHVSESERVLLRSAFRIATASVIDRYTGITPSAIIEIVVDIRGYVDLNGELTIDEVRGVLSAVRDQYGLSAAELVALDEIVQAVRSNLDTDRAGKATATLGEILTWIESAAVIAGT